MDREKFISLRNELALYDKFRFSKEIRHLATSAVEFINTNLDSFESIADPASPVVEMIGKLFTDKKCAKYQNRYYPIIAESVAALVFKDEALSVVTRYVCQSLSRRPFDLCHEMVSVLPSLLLFEFPSFYAIQACFSLLLAMMSHEDGTISGVAYATFQQVLDLLIEKIENAKADRQATFREEAARIKGPAVDEFENPLFYILYMLFDDLSCISMHVPVKFLVIEEGPHALIFDLLETILNTNGVVFDECPPLGNVFEGTVIQSMSDWHSLPFIVGFIDRCVLQHPSLCAAVVSEYIGQMRADNDRLYLPLYLTHCISIKRENLALDFYLQADKDGLTNAMFAKLGSLFDESEPDHALSFPMKVCKLDKIQGDRNFLSIAPHEITFGALAAFSESDDEKLKYFIEASQFTVKKIVLHGVKYCDLDGFSLATDALLSYLTLMVQFNQDLCRHDVIQMLCNYGLLANSQDMNDEQRERFYVSEKNMNWSSFLYKVVMYLPQICKGEWPLILATLFGANEVIELSPSFASKFANETVKEILEALLQCRPFPYVFITDFIVVNIVRFEVLWPVVVDYVEMSQGRAGQMLCIKDMFIEFLSKGFVDSTEEQILAVGAKIMNGNSGLSPDGKTEVLQAIRRAFSENSEVIKKGWKWLFTILDPSNFEDSDDLVSESFSVTNIIIGAYANSLEPDDLRSCMDLVFKFSCQKQLINVSLSSFDLLWAITRAITSVEDWTKILFDLSQIFKDERVDVALGAVRTFFTIFSSNSSSIPDSIYDHYLKEGWPMIMTLEDSASQAHIQVVEVTIQEIAHVITNFWDRFNIEYLKSTFLPFFIAAEEKMLIESQAPDVTVAGFELYYTFYDSSHLDNDIHKLLCASLVRLANDKLVHITNPNAIELSQFGRLLGTIISGFKDKLDSVPYDEWLSIAHNLALQFKTSEFVHITTQRTLDGFAPLFPMPKEYSDKTLNLFLDLYNTAPDDQIRKAVCNDLADIWRNIDTKANMLFLCKHIYSCPMSERLCKKVVKTVLTFTDAQVPDAIECYKIIAAAHEPLKKKASARLSELGYRE